MFGFGKKKNNKKDSQKPENTPYIIRGSVKEVNKSKVETNSAAIVDNNLTAMDFFNSITDKVKIYSVNDIPIITESDAEKYKKTKTKTGQRLFFTATDDTKIIEIKNYDAPAVIDEKIKQKIKEIENTTYKIDCRVENELIIKTTTYFSKKETIARLQLISKNDIPKLQLVLYPNILDHYETENEQQIKDLINNYIEKSNMWFPVLKPEESTASSSHLSLSR